MACHNGLQLASTTPHRLPTISGSHIWQRLKENPPRTIPTGLPLLDNTLLGRPPGDRNIGAKRVQGGLLRGRVSEVWGPPGVGKTAFGLQAAATTIKDGEKVVWVDCGTQLVRKRLEDTLSAIRPPGELEDPGSGQANPSTEEMLRKQFFHYTTPTLPHLLALFLHPVQPFPPPDTALIVIDSISTLFDLAFHRTFVYTGLSKKNDQEKWAANRRLAIMGDLISKIGRMAALHDIAVLLTCQTTTRLRSGIGLGALLLPAMSSVEWDNGIATRLVLFRDWPPNDVVKLGEEKERWEKLRYAGVIKIDGVLMAEEGGIDTVVPFSVEREGLRELAMPVTKLTGVLASSPAKPSKRPLTEIADSEEELVSGDEYGWGDEDELAAEGLINDENLLRESKAAKV